MRADFLVLLEMKEADIQLLLMFQRRCKPTFAALAVIEARFTVAQSISAGSVQLTTTVVAGFLVL